MTQEQTKTTSQDKFFMIPNKYIINTKNESNVIIPPLLKSSGHKELIHLHCILMDIRNMHYEINTTLGVILNMMGVNPRKENVDKLKVTMAKLIEVDLVDAKANTYLYFTYNPFIGENGGNGDFFNIKSDNVEKLLLASDGKRGKYNYINIYSYLYCRMFKLPKGRVYSMFGEYETCYPSHEEMINALSIGKNDLIDSLKWLKDNKYIYYDNAGYYKTNNGVRKARNTYIITDRHEYKEQVRLSIKYYKERMSVERDYEWIKD